MNISSTIRAATHVSSPVLPNAIWFGIREIHLKLTFDSVYYLVLWTSQALSGISAVSHVYPHQFFWMLLDLASERSTSNSPLIVSPLFFFRNLIFVIGRVINKKTSLCKIFCSPFTANKNFIWKQSEKIYVPR